jgi:hypothetical protein
MEVVRDHRHCISWRQDGKGATAMHNRDCCPVCHGTGTLVPLGTRLDHPHRWMPWVTATTHLFLCEQCDALIETRTQARVEMSTPEVAAMIGGERVLAISAA